MGRSYLEDVNSWPGFEKCALRILGEISQSTAKITSSSIVRQIEASMARLLKTSKTEAANFARVVDLKPQMSSTDATVR